MGGFCPIWRWGEAMISFSWWITLWNDMRFVHTDMCKPREHGARAVEILPECKAAIINFASYEHACAALKGLQGALIGKITRPGLSVSWRRRDDEPPQNKQTTSIIANNDKSTPRERPPFFGLWVGNVHASLVHEEEFRSAFEKYGELCSPQVPKKNIFRDPLVCHRMNTACAHMHTHEVLGLFHIRHGDCLIMGIGCGFSRPWTHYTCQKYAYVDSTNFCCWFFWNAMCSRAEIACMQFWRACPGCCALVILCAVTWKRPQTCTMLIFLCWWIPNVCSVMSYFACTCIYTTTRGSWCAMRGSFFTHRHPKQRKIHIQKSWKNTHAAQKKIAVHPVFVVKWDLFWNISYQSPQILPRCVFPSTHVHAPMGIQGRKNLEILISFLETLYCKHTRVHTRIHLPSASSYICARICMFAKSLNVFIHVCMHVCICINPTCTHGSNPLTVPLYTHIHTHTHKHVPLIHSHVFKSLTVSSHTHTHTHTHTNTHTNMFRSSIHTFLNLAHVHTTSF